ncbi:hypothetical protein Lal_00022767 [Lupinus albus]|nr:hypothetical protein Lal_00022767 [Lupinus albus]
MCDSWTDSINHKHIMNFIVYSTKELFSQISLMHLMPIAEIQITTSMGEEYVIQIVTDNEKALKAADQNLMEQRPHLYWFSCSAHCLDLRLEDIGKKKSVQKSMDEEKTATTFIYNHI